MRQWRALLHRVAVSVISVLALTVVLGGFAAIPAVQAASQVSRAAPVPVIPGRTATIPGIPGGLDAVSATSATNAWAAGTQTLASGHVGTLILHWNGTTWSKVASPTPGSKYTTLTGVSADSPADAWAVGNYGNATCTSSTNVILHWNGTAWSQVASPNPGAACNYLNGVTAISPTDAWAVGQSCAVAINTCSTLILHWNGTAWSKVASPSPGPGGYYPLTAVTADSPTDAWATGYYCTISSCATRAMLFLHWNGTAWSQVKTPNPGPGIYYPSSVSADSPTDAWATGLYCTTTNSCDVEHTLILHWNGTAWSKVASPRPGPARNGLNGVTAISPTDAWAVGGYCAPHACPDSTTLILHWNGTAWSRVTSPDPGAENGLGAVSATTPSNVWAVGFDDADALTLHWNGTAWSETSG
jgi:hypothetical protein